MAKLPQKTYPYGHGLNDFSCFGPPATKDGEFTDTMICDMGCFTQEGKDTNKYYHGCVAQSKINNNWYAYFEWGRQGAKNPSFQFIECSSKSEAQREYEKQLHAKNDKRGQWANHATLGRVLQAKAGKDCYLVRPQATRSTGLPDARTIKHQDGLTKVRPEAKKIRKVSTCDSETFKLMRDINVATVSYTRGSMADDSLPTQAAIDEGRDILSAALSRVKFVGHNVSNQIHDKELINLTRHIYSRIPKKKDRGTKPETWILSQNNIGLWQQDLDAFESALSVVENDSIQSNDPFGGMQINMEWLPPQHPLGEFIGSWMPRATRNKHKYIDKIQIRNVWSVERKEEKQLFEKEINEKLPNMPAHFKEKPYHQPTNRPDLSPQEFIKYKKTNAALLFHGSRSVNVSGLLREGFRFPKELINVKLTAAMFSGGGGGIYYADDFKKSAGYTSLKTAYWSAGDGAIKGRGAFMFLCDVILGVPHVAPGPFPYTEYPHGTHCIFGKAGHSQVKNNEWIILKKPQYRFRYLVEFVA